MSIRDKVKHGSSQGDFLDAMGLGWVRPAVMTFARVNGRGLPAKAVSYSDWLEFFTPLSGTRVNGGAR
jgi:hypothetical protein